MNGKVLGNRYEIIEKIGGGGMAVVYKAKDKLLNRYVAIKILRQEFTNDQDFIEKFRQESLSAASLTHPNIVSIYDTGVDENIYYIVMEYVKGMTLKKYINKKGIIEENEAINITRQIAEALKHAHKNKVIHRDIKPHNILMTEENIAKVADFGIARAANTSTIINTSNVIGSVHYFSPEQARGGYVDEKSDIYSLGVVMYEMVTGEVPFDADNHITVAMKHVNEKVIPPTIKNNKISKNYEKIILKCLNKQQSYRYQNINELLDDLKKVSQNKEYAVTNFNDRIKSSPTIIVPKIEEVLVEDDPEKENALKRFFSDNKDVLVDDDTDHYVKSKSKIKTAILAILLALVITAIVAMFAFRYIKNYLTVKEVPVPQLVGLSEELAQKTVDDLDLGLKVEDRIYSSEYEEGIVIRQKIESGEFLKKDFPISVIISKGQKYVNVPDLYKEPSNEVDIILSGVELEEGEDSHEYSNDIPLGLVISQNPKAGQEVAIGTKVDYVISKGPEIEYKLVPTLVGLNIEDAKLKIKEKGFSVGNITDDYSEEYEVNKVIYQSYPAEQEVEENSSIDLIISKGKKPDDTNSTDSGIGTDIDGDDNTTNELITKTIHVDLPDERDSVMVTIERVDDNGNRQSVYQKRHKTSEEGIDVSVQGRGEQKFEVFIDSELYDSVDVKFVKEN